MDYKNSYKKQPAPSETVALPPLSGCSLVLGRLKIVMRAVRTAALHKLVLVMCAVRRLTDPWGF